MAATNTTIQITSPVGGLNFRDPLPNMSPTDALMLDNFIARPAAIELRGGYREWFTSINRQVHTLMPYQTGSRINNRFFAATVGAIHDITGGMKVGKGLSGITQIPDDFTGVWSYVNYSQGDRKYLLAVNQGAGYWTYDYIDGWKKRNIEGLPNDNLTSINVWQNRVWITVADSSIAYYLGIGEILDGSKAEEFDFGAQFRVGGAVQTIMNWTHDSGFGVNDYQVVISTGGDAVIYKGTDPESLDTYSLVGCWYVGKPPLGDRFYTKLGGDVIFITDLGLISLNGLVTGKEVELAIQNPMVSKIQPALSPIISSQLYSERWELRLIAPQDLLMLVTPQNPDGTYTQYVQCLTSSAWSTFSNMPIFCSENYDRDFYFADSSGNIYKAFVANNDGEGYLGEYGQDIVGSVMTAFQNFGMPTNIKRFQLIKPMFIASNQPSVSIDLIVDYKQDVDTVPANLPRNTYGSFWDRNKWDNAYWSSSNNPYSDWIGLDGVGWMGALQMKVKGEPKTQYIGSFVTIEQGGTL